MVEVRIEEIARVIYFMDMCVAHPFCDSLANALLVNYLIFSPCSNLLQMAAKMNMLNHHEW